MFEVQPIAFVRSDREEVWDDFWGGVDARIELAPNVPVESLDGLEDFSHAEILLVFDRVAPEAVVTGARHPRNNPDWPRMGIFAQRAKGRPNRLGSTIVRILSRLGPSLHVAGLDAVNGTPVLDIKPVIAEFLPQEPVCQPEWSRLLMRDYWRQAIEREVPASTGSDV